MSPLLWSLIQIAGQPEPAPRVAPYNPRPLGWMAPEGAPAAIVALLRQHPGRWWTSEQLIRETGKSHAAVSWALLRLRGWGLVTTMPDTTRNSRYLRYRAQEPAGAELGGATV